MPQCHRPRAVCFLFDPLKSLLHPNFCFPIVVSPVGKDKIDFPPKFHRNLTLSVKSWNVLLQIGEAIWIWRNKKQNVHLSVKGGGVLGCHVSFVCLTWRRWTWLFGESFKPIKNICSFVRHLSYYETFLIPKLSVSCLSCNMMYHSISLASLVKAPQKIVFIQPLFSHPFVHRCPNWCLIGM